MTNWNSANPTAAVIRERAPGIPADARIYDRYADALWSAQEMADRTGESWAIVHERQYSGDGYAVVSRWFADTYAEWLTRYAVRSPRVAA